MMVPLHRYGHWWTTSDRQPGEASFYGHFSFLQRISIERKREHEKERQLPMFALVQGLHSRQHACQYWPRRVHGRTRLRHAQGTNVGGRPADTLSFAWSCCLCKGVLGDGLDPAAKGTASSAV
ncbi:hypothetical protein IG631_24108 [Alternaria alternata]|nr:hypothetical protein IG631_24108 [Alternaria alternata]